MDGEHDPKRPFKAPRPSSQPSPEDWARRLQQGEPTAVQEVRKRVGKVLHFHGLAIPVQERGDLEQEVMTEVWQAVHRPGFDLAGGFWGFVEIVTSRRCIDWIRTRRDKLSLPQEAVSPEGGPLRDTLHRERIALASRILSELELECRNLIVSRLRDDLSYREITQATGKSEGALRVKLYRCIRNAQKVWKRLSEASEIQREDGRG